MVIHRSDLHGTFLRACRARRRRPASPTSRSSATSTCPVRRRRAVPSPTATRRGRSRHRRRRPALGRPQRCSSTTSRSARPTSPTAAPCPIDAGRDERRVDVATSSSTSGPAATSCSTRCAAARCSTRSRCSSRPRRCAGEDDWGTPDELDAAFAGTCDQVQQGLPLMWRDRWWRMFDRDPIMTWVHGRIALLGDAAHPPLQYMAQGAIMAIEDGWVLAEHVAAQQAVRSEPARASTGTPLWRRTTPSGRRALPPRADHRPRVGRAVAPRRRARRAAQRRPARPGHPRLHLHRLDLRPDGARPRTRSRRCSRSSRCRRSRSTSRRGSEPGCPHRAEDNSGRAPVGRGHCSCRDGQPRVKGSTSRDGCWASR